MKAFALTLLAASISFATSAQNTDGDVFASNKRIERGGSATRSEVRRDLVGADFAPATANSIILMREARHTANGWEVKVKAADGSLRMKGTYSDEQLTMANGTFSYYHDNGKLESQGSYVNGVKSGVWLRFDRAGSPKAEKVYGGQNYEQMANTYGWNTPQVKN